MKVHRITRSKSKKPSASRRGNVEVILEKSGDAIIGDTAEAPTPKKLDQEAERDQEQPVQSTYLVNGSSESTTTSVDPHQSPQGSPDTLPRVVGNLDEVSLTGIRGWAYDPARPNVPVSVELHIDGRYVLRADADHYRADLHAAGLGDGTCAFMILPPSSLLDGANHSLRIVPTNGTSDLRNSPTVVRLAMPVPSFHLAKVLMAIRSVEQQLHAIQRSLGLELAHTAAVTSDVSQYTTWATSKKSDVNANREWHIAQIATLRHPVKISVLVPTYNTPRDMLESAVRSVRQQIYPNWELCICDDNSTAEHVRPMLEEFSRQDPRIKVKFRQSNGHISAATNDCLALATGEYVALLDHDDELSDDALSYVAQAIEATRASVLYSDEDKIDSNGLRHAPHFKPAFNYTMLLAHNYVCHLLVAKTELVRSIGGLRDDMVGSQDHDLILRLSEVVDREAIVHIPQILYHWRAHQNSTALDPSVKKYTVNAGRHAVQLHLRKEAPSAIIQPQKHGFRIKWPVPSNRPLVSIIIPTRDCADILSKCLASISTLTKYTEYEIIVIDNESSSDETFALFDEMQKDPKIRLIRHPGIFNYSQICNHAAREANGQLLLFLNNDIEVPLGSEEWLTELVGQVLRPGVGAVGCKLLYPDGTIQHAGIACGVLGLAGHSFRHFAGDAPGYVNRINTAHEVTCCTAACLIVRRNVFEEIGGFDEVNLPVAFNDVDLCIRIREARWKIVYTPYSVLIHHESYSRGPEDTPAKGLRSRKELAFMLRRWERWLSDDPAYNPSLTLDREDYSLGVDRHAAAGIWRYPTHESSPATRDVQTAGT